MKVIHLLRVWLVPGLLTLFSGCAFVTKSELDAAQTKNRVLAEQNRAQLAEIENRKTHSRNAEDQLTRTEERLAALEEQLGLDRKQLANYQRERDQLYQQFKGLADGRSCVSPEMRQRLADISQRCPNLHFDPQTGVSKFDTDILFDSGKADLKPGADRVLTQLVELLKSPDARDLKVLVVGHTDDRAIAKKPLRELYSGNFDLSTTRAQTVADFLRRAGVEEQRLGVAGFGSHQPIAPNVTTQDRQKNRRVEIFVMAPEAPVVGWTDSIPGVY